VGRLTCDLAVPAHGLFLHHGDPGSVHLHIQDGNRLTPGNRQVERQGFVSFLVFALRDIGSGPLRCTLHRFGRHLQAGEDLHLFPPLIEGGLLPHQRLHAPHSGREIRVPDVQFDIGRELASVTVRA
jgi:hypothetical protein